MILYNVIFIPIWKQFFFCKGIIKFKLSPCKNYSSYKNKIDYRFNFIEKNHLKNNFI